MTGAGIVEAARTAALLSVDARAELIGMVFVLEAIERQFRSEARVLTEGDLGDLAHLVEHV